MLNSIRCLTISQWRVMLSRHQHFKPSTYKLDLQCVPKSDTLLVFEFLTLVRCITWWFLLASRVWEKLALFSIKLGAKVRSSYYRERVVGEGLLPDIRAKCRQYRWTLHSPAGWCTTAHCEKHAWAVQQQGGQIEHIAVWISSSKCWNCWNSVNIWCFAVYMILYWQVDKVVTFWHTL